MARSLAVYWWGWKPWRWRFYYVRKSKAGPFGEVLLGPVSLVWSVSDRSENG